MRPSAAQRGSGAYWCVQYCNKNTTDSAALQPARGKISGPTDKNVETRDCAARADFARSNGKFARFSRGGARTEPKN
jgi:hypothetical protein